MTAAELSLSDVKKIASLARLGLSGPEAEVARRDLAAILANFSKIQTVNTDQTPTSDDITGLTNITRSDQVKPDSLCSADSLINNAPAVHLGHIKVKTVFS